MKGKGFLGTEVGQFHETASNPVCSPSNPSFLILFFLTLPYCGS